MQVVMSMERNSMNSCISLFCILPLIRSAILKMSTVYRGICESQSTCFFISDSYDYNFDTRYHDEFYPDTLQQVLLDLISPERCSSDEFAYGDLVTEEMICAGEPGVDTCQVRRKK